MTVHTAKDTKMDQSGMLATGFCPTHSRKGVVILPIGHPLYDFTASSYQSVLTDYLGEYANIRLTSDSNANDAMLQSRTCVLHQTPVFYTEQTMLNQQLVSDAQRLLEAARQQLSNLPQQHPSYASLYYAIEGLNSAIASGPSNDALAAAMGALTQAMASAQGSW